MRSLPFSATQNLGLAALITIQRGLDLIRFATFHTEVVSDGASFPPGPGARITTIEFPSDGTPSSLDITIMAAAGGIIEPGDAIDGGLDGWPIKIELFDFGNPDAGTFDLISSAAITDVSEDGNGVVTISVNGPLNRASGPMTEHFTLTGREDLGDDRCKIPILPAEIGRGVTFVRPDIATGLLAVNDAYGRVRTGSAGTVEDFANVYFECTTAGVTDASTAPTYDPTVGNSTTDGTAVFIARDAWLRHARGVWTGDFTIQLDALPDPRASDPTWYLLGGIYVRSGPLKGFPKIPIRAWDPDTLTVTTFLPIGENDIPSDTQLEIHAGCDLTRDQCFSRFNNIVNLRAETFVPPSNNIAAL